MIFGDVMYFATGGKVNPLIGSAGVSAVPMAARVAQTVGQKENPSNFLLMHAMGPNVAGVIGSAVAAGFMIKVFRRLILPESFDSKRNPISVFPRPLFSEVGEIFLQEVQQKGWSTRFKNLPIPFCVPGD